MNKLSTWKGKLNIKRITSLFLIGLLWLGIGSNATGCSKDKEVKSFSAFIAVNGSSYEGDTRIRQKIADITGATVSTEWLTGQTAQEKISAMISNESYPDFILGSDATDLLLEAGAFIPLEDYLDDYPNLKAYLTDQQWESLKDQDGHIYYIPSFGVINGDSMDTIQSGEAFWIQKRVLEWADYPEISTLDDYFDLIEAYIEANPTTEGQDTIGFEILCDDWRYFCLENPPMFLAGYPNDGCAIVDEDTQEAADYDTIPEAKLYYEKLNEMYKKGIVDKETFTLSFQQYLEKLSSGRVLGMCDQYWEIMDAQNSLYSAGQDQYTYVPFPIVADDSISPNYLVTEQSLNVSDGMGISVNCQDVEGALSFLDALLSPEVMILRNWGEKGTDYEVDQDGYFYRTDQQRSNWDDSDYLEENACSYAYFPSYEGLLADNKNAVTPAEQPDEFYSTLSDYDKNILDKYGHKTWKEFMGEEKEGQPWYPLYSATGNWPADSAYGKADRDMDTIKKEWLPKVIMSSDFDTEWENYMDSYQENIDVDAYLKKLDAEIQDRIQLFSQFSSS